MYVCGVAVVGHTKPPYPTPFLTLNATHGTNSKLALPQFQGSFPEILLTDTVGFIQKLPTQLIAAFRATLEVRTTLECCCVGWGENDGDAIAPMTQHHHATTCLYQYDNRRYTWRTCWCTWWTPPTPCGASR